MDAVVDDGAAAAVLADDRAAELLADGQAVGLTSSAPAAVEVRAIDDDGVAGDVIATHEVVPVESVHGDAYRLLPDVLLPASEIEARPTTRHLLLGDGPLDDATVEAAAAAATAIGDTVFVTAEHTFLSESGPINAGITIAGGIGGLAIVAVAIALAAA
ncbi:MAG: hypothetical protein WD378_00070, partial [Egicoccus sp.]